MMGKIIVFSLFLSLSKIIARDEISDRGSRNALNGVF